MNELPVDANSINCGDCWDPNTGIPAMPDDSVEAVITDPPYGVDFAEWDTPPDDTAVDEFLRVARGPVVMFGAAPMSSVKVFTDLDPMRMLIWAPSFTLSKTASHGIYYRYHPIWCWRLCAQHRGPKWDVFTFPTGGHNWWKHPCTKPLALMKELVRLAAAPNGDDSHRVILDPFAGSGTTCVAAKETGMQYIGYEIDDEYVEVARERIARAEAKPRLDLTDEPKCDTLFAD